MQLDKNRKERIIWRSRRGLLEMDLILERFLSKHLDSLSEDEILVLPSRRIASYTVRAALFIAR